MSLSHLPDNHQCQNYYKAIRELVNFGLSRGAQGEPMKAKQLLLWPS